MGGATIDCLSREAAFSGTVERLQPQNLKVLVALTEARGRVVTRDELVDRCWDGRVIGEDVINRAISTLRQFASRAGGFEIETVPRAGYRLTELVGRWRKPPWPIAAIVAACALGASIATYGVYRRTTAPTVLTVEVLPFDTSSPDPADRRIAFAARDSVANALSQTRFSVVQDQPGTQHPPAADFVVRADVIGSLQAVSVTIRMEQASSHIIVYSHQFTTARGKVWSLSGMIGPQVAGSLGWIVPLLLTDQRYPSNPQILADLLQNSGQDAWLGQYERTRYVAQGAPNSAVAQFALALSTGFWLKSLPREQRADAAAIGRQAAERAELLDSRYGDTGIPWCLLHSRSRMIECEDRLRGAMKRDPDAPWVEYFLANEIKDGGRAEEALILARHSLNDDQFVPYKIALVLRLLEATGRSDEAEQLYRQSYQWWPDHSIIIWDRIYGIMDRGDFPALARFKNELAGDNLSSDLSDSLKIIPPLVADVNRRDVVALRKECALDQPASFKRDLCTVAFTQAEDLDDAFALAAKGFPDRVGRSPADQDKIWLDDPYPTDTDILTESGAAPLRQDPRFVALAQRLGILAYWKSDRWPDFCRSAHPDVFCKSLNAKG